jgi:xylulokinase
MTDTLLSLDVGTTAVKAVLFDPDGSLLSVAECALTLHTPQPGYVELDPEELWRAVLDVLRQTASRAHAYKILALAVTTQGGSFLATDAAGMPTTPVITWMDSRSQPVVSEWKQCGLEPEIRRICGWSLDPGLPLPMIGWLRAHRPEIFNNSAHFLSVNDFLTHRLAGVYSMNPSMAGEMMLTDIASGGWSPTLCDLVGIQPDQLSPIRPSDAVLGPILPEVSLSTGLASQVVVINGGQDHTCEAMAVGMTGPGTALLACGTAWVINGATARGDMASVPEGMNLNFHVVPERWIVSQFLGGLGGTLEWWVNRLWQSPDSNYPIERSRLYDLMDEALKQTHPGAGGLYFFPLGGSRNGPGSTGVGGFWGLQWEHTRADMTRAVMECAVYELHRSMEKLKTGGLAMDNIWMIGGAARSPLWPSIAASLTGTAVTLTHYPHGPALGAAILAGSAVGIYPDFETGRACFDLKSRQVFPDETQHSLYEEHYRDYCRLIHSYETPVKGKF